MFNLIKFAKEIDQKNIKKQRKFSQVVKHMDHALYQESLKTKTVEELKFIIKDAKEAIEAMPLGPNAGYYADEIHYAAMELKRRRQDDELNKGHVFASKTPAWTRSEGKSESGGLNEKGRKSYEKDNPGSDLKPPVTESNPSGKRKKRQDSYCARSKGQMKMHNIDCKKDPDKRICKARRKWSCN